MNDLTDIIFWAGLIASIALCVAISWVDYHEHRIPNRLVAPLAAGTTVWLLVLGAVADDLASAATSLLIGLAVAGITLAIGLATSGVGMGDVKLIAPMAATIAWLGRSPSLTALVATGAAALAASALALVQGKGLSHRIPLAPALTVGLVAATINHGLAQ